MTADLPAGCQQFGCREPAETWCPLCESYYCDYHDSLYPVRHHDCLFSVGVTEIHSAAHSGQRQLHQLLAQ